ncbi:MAG: cation:proton antiporter [Gammaproteobacteria bacterium]|nr:cation:proton antiporter [Gammaproteobacteria bacterium]
MHDPIVFSFFLIFTGAAVLGTVALYARQSLLLAYIAVGVLFGPSVLGLIPNLELIEQISHIGITFLLFLLGLDLQPRELIHLLRKTTMITLASATVFALIGFTAGLLAGFNTQEALLIGAAAMFSSTIIGIKLLPTTVLHHQHAGEIMTSVLLLQDLIAILVLLLLQGHQGGEGVLLDIALLGLFLILLVIAAFLVEAWLLNRLLARFDRIREYIFLLTIGWCLGLAELSAWLGLSTEIGAFIAGISLAASPISQYIADSLRPLRDFFLVVFFFSLGGALELNMLASVVLPAALFALALLAVKPWVFRWLLTTAGETPHLSLEMGVRLGQISEFSLLIAVLAAATGFIGERASYFIQAATILTFVVSSWYIVRTYPTPIAVSDALRRD